MARLGRLFELCAEHLWLTLTALVLIAAFIIGTIRGPSASHPDPTRTPACLKSGDLGACPHRVDDP